MDNISIDFQDFLKKCSNGQTQSFKYEYEDCFKNNLNLLNKIDINGLTEEDLFMILSYTARSSGWVNSDLRIGSPVKPKCKQEFIRRLDNALTKIRSFDNEIVYRMDNPLGSKKDIIAWFKQKQGCVFLLPYFLSTSKDKWKDRPIIWKIKTLKTGSLGKDITKLANDATLAKDASEKEVLFKTGACFKIKRVSTKMVHLMEVPNDTIPDFELTGDYWLS